MKIAVKKSSTIICLLIAMLFALSSCFNVTISEQIVSAERAENALNEALSCESKPYIWGGNGPDTFDCSGLIIWSYQQAADKTLYYQNSNGLERDIRMDDLFNYNASLITSANVRPGDIVFVTKNAVWLLTEDYSLNGLMKIHFYTSTLHRSMEKLL